MALVRCPSCGRVADGKSCFACGHEWTDDAATPLAPAGIAAVSKNSAGNDEAAHADVSVDIDIDVDIDVGGDDDLDPRAQPKTAPSALAAEPPWLSPAAVSPFVLQALAPLSSPPEQGFGSSPPAFGHSPPLELSSFPPPALPAVGAGWAVPPSTHAAAPGTKHPSGNWSAAAAQDLNSTWGATPAAAAPLVRNPTWPAAPAVLPPSPFAFDSKAHQGAPPPPPPAVLRPAGAAIHGGSSAAVPPPSSVDPTKLWAPPPAPVVLEELLPTRMTAAAVGAAPPGRQPSPGLQGLFDDVTVATGVETQLQPDFEVTQVLLPYEVSASDPGGVPVEPAVDHSVRDATQDAGDFFQFTLEPASGVDPVPDADPSSFHDGGRDDAAVHAIPNHNDLAPELPPAFSLADIAALDVVFTLTADLPTSPVAATLNAGIRDFAPIDGFGTGAAPTFVALVDKPLEAGLQQTAGAVPTLAVPTLAVPTPAVHPPALGLAEEDFSFANFDAPRAPARRRPPPLPDDDFNLVTSDNLSSGLDDKQFTLDETDGVMASTAPSLAERVGELAQSLEEGGRSADAALLYEVQAVLTSSAR